LQEEQNKNLAAQKERAKSQCPSSLPDHSANLFLQVRRSQIGGRVTNTSIKSSLLSHRKLWPRHSAISSSTATYALWLMQFYSLLTQTRFECSNIQPIPNSDNIITGGDRQIKSVSIRKLYLAFLIQAQLVFFPAIPDQR